MLQIQESHQKMHPIVQLLAALLQQVGQQGAQKTWETPAVRRPLAAHRKYKHVFWQLPCGGSSFLSLPQLVLLWWQKEGVLPLQDSCECGCICTVLLETHPPQLNHVVRTLPSSVEGSLYHHLLPTRIGLEGGRTGQFRAQGSLLLLHP